MAVRLYLLLLIYVTNGFDWDKIPMDTKYLPKHQPLEYPQSVNAPDSDLECKMRTLALEFAQKIQPFRSQKKTADALNLEAYCKGYKNNMTDFIYHINSDIIDNDSIFTVYVDPKNGNDANKGDKTNPLLSLTAALNLCRSQQSNSLKKQIIIREGMIFLTESINLSPTTFDSNLEIRSYPHENVTISGGILLNATTLNWQRYNDGNDTHNIWMTKIENANLYNNSIFSLFSLNPHRRLTRARYPNGEVSVFDHNSYYLNPYQIDRWHTLEPKVSSEPVQYFKDLSNCSESDPCLPYSSNEQFNTFTEGQNGLCDLWNAPDCFLSDCWSYWCGKNCHGGWAEEDQRMSTLGTRQLPIGMSFNKKRISELTKMNLTDDTILHVHHSQGWFVDFYKIDAANSDVENGNISLGSGGWQGGRVWTLTRELNSGATTNIPIMGGPMYFDNIMDALDAPNEWFYDPQSEILYFWPNDTKIGQPPSKDIDLVIGNLSNLFTFSSPSHEEPLTNVHIQDINFRDTRYTYMERWFTPSGGDWAFYRGGAMFFENVTNSSIAGCYFSYLDGNVITLSGFTRDVHLYRNEFGYIGDNVMAGVGFTDHEDGRNGLQPRNTVLRENYVYHIGLYQLQSSMWFQARSCLNSLVSNIAFNIPRAAILFNDAFGGGNEVFTNLLFNTCTESGDHGPMNSWNRMPFLTNVAHGKPSYDNLMTNVSGNYIFANFGGSQAFDTDDGSAWFNMFNNVFYCAMAYKNDYGGYNVNYWNNINVAWTWDGPQNCWGVGGILPKGPANKLYNNTCIVYGNTRPENVDYVGQFASTDTVQNSPMELYDNKYYTLHGNATIIAGDQSRNSIPEMRRKYGLEMGSTYDVLPSNEEILDWSKKMLEL